VNDNERFHDGHQSARSDPEQTPLQHRTNQHRVVHFTSPRTSTRSASHAVSDARFDSESALRFGGAGHRIRAAQTFVNDVREMRILDRRGDAFLVG